MLTLFYSIHFLHKLFTLFDQFQSEDEDQFVVPGHGMPEADRDCWWAEGKTLNKTNQWKFSCHTWNWQPWNPWPRYGSPSRMITYLGQYHSVMQWQTVFPGSSFLWEEDGPGGWGRYPWWWVQGNLDNVATTPKFCWTERSLCYCDYSYLLQGYVLRITGGNDKQGFPMKQVNSFPSRCKNRIKSAPKPSPHWFRSYCWDQLLRVIDWPFA